MFLLATRLSQTNSGLCLSYSAKMMIKILNTFRQFITQTTDEESLHELKYLNLKREWASLIVWK